MPKAAKTQDKNFISLENVVGERLAMLCKKMGLDEIGIEPEDVIDHPKVAIKAKKILKNSGVIGIDISDKNWTMTVFGD